MANLLGLLRRSNGTLMRIHGMHLQNGIRMLHVDGAYVDFWATPRQLQKHGYRIIRATPLVWDIWGKSFDG